MSAITIEQIDQRLERLPPDKLKLVYDFVSSLLNRETKRQQRPEGAFATMAASEAVLRRDWERPEEDEAWADL